MLGCTTAMSECQDTDHTYTEFQVDHLELQRYKKMNKRKIYIQYISFQFSKKVLIFLHGGMNSILKF